MSQVKLAFFRAMATSELVASLRPGETGCLVTRPDGTVLEGHHRLVVCASAVSTSTRCREKCVRVRTETNMRTKVFWVADMENGRLGILPRPRGGDWLSDEVAAWREAGVDMVVSLLEAEEAEQLVLEGEAAAAASSGIAFRAFPIPDRGVPASKESVAELAAEIIAALDQGRSIAVHCRQGIGRSGLIAGGVLVATGKKPDAALKAVAEARGLEVPETPEQRRWLEDFARWLDSTRAAQPRHAADGGV